MAAEQFRKMLEAFYLQIYSGQHADVYHKILVELFDEAEVEPIHVVAIPEQPSYRPSQSSPAKKSHGNRQVLYKNTDFASVFLFAYLMGMLKRCNPAELKKLQDTVHKNLDVFFSGKHSDDAHKHRFMFQGLFQFCQYSMMHNYEPMQIEKIFKAFYLNNFERRGLKKTDKQKYLTEPQALLSFILAQNGSYPSKKQICNPTSDTYQSNNMQFCLAIENPETKETVTIGHGDHRINIVKQKGEYYVYEDVVDAGTDADEELCSVWLQILSQSNQIKKQQSDRTGSLMSTLNIQQECSPAKSVKQPKIDLKVHRVGHFL